MSSAQIQHYISNFLMNYWADDDDNVGVVCLHHRDSATMRAKSLHWLRNLSSEEQEREWSLIEGRASDVINGLRKKFESSGDDLAPAETFLTKPHNHTALIDLVILHYARSLIVPVEQLLNGATTLDSAACEARIQQRFRDAQSFHDCGIVLTVTQPDVPLALGAVPVFNTEDWGGYIPGTGRYMMPLTPRMAITGTPDLSAGQVEVVAAENLDQKHFLELQLAGERGKFNTLYLICEPSELESTASTALASVEGGGLHWYALRSRIARYGDSAATNVHEEWQRRIRRYEHNLERHDRLASEGQAVKRIQGEMREDARKIQTDLDKLKVPICDCGRSRNNSDHKTLWKIVMPQVICDEIREKRRAACG